MRVRHWNVVCHRDVGYLVCGLTLAYAISGLAVNHTEDWNPNYQIVHEERRFAPIAAGERDAMAAELVEKLGLPGLPREAFRSRSEQLELFYDGFSVKADAALGVAQIERTRERAVLRDLNFLHLNHAKGAWTWVADLYAIALGFMAVSGLFIARGKTSLSGRGKWWVAAGLAVPAGFVLALRYL